MNDVEYDIKKEYNLEDLEMLLDKIPYSVWIKDNDEKYKYVNKSFEENSGKCKKDIIGNGDSDNYNGIFKKLFRKNDIDMLESKVGILIEENITINGKNKYFETYKAPLPSNGKRSKWVLGISREVTLDKNIMYEIGKNSANLLDEKYDNEINSLKKDNGLEEILNDLNKRLRADDIWLFLYDENNDELKLHFKTGTSKIIDYNYKVYIDKNIKKDLLKNNVYDNSRSIKESKFYRYCINNSNNENDKQDSYIRTYSLKYKNQLIGVLNIYYQKGNIPRYNQDDFVKFTCDKFAMIIKNRLLSKALKEELNRRVETEKELESFLEIATDLWGILGADYHLKDVSNNCVEIFGWSVDELKKLNAVSLIHPDDRKRAFKEMDFSSQKGKRTFLLNRFLCKNGEYKLIEWNWCCLEEGKTALLTGKDVTEKKKLEEDKKRLEEAIALENLKSEFFANVSHEFKTPLNIILATVQLISKKLEDNKFKDNIIISSKYINGIKQNAYRLLRLVNNLIDITKIDSGLYKLNLKNYNIVNVIEDIVLSVSEYIVPKGRNIIFDTSEEEIIVTLDLNKIQKIILNLLSNSVKYTDYGGTIKVNLSINKEKDKVIITITDDGLGIPKENIDKIFQRFKQLDNLFTRRCEGTGIGLAIVKSLVEMHGGEIRVNKNIVKGAEFIFDIPIKKVKGEERIEFYTKELDLKIEECKIEFSDIYSI